MRIYNLNFERSKYVNQTKPIYFGLIQFNCIYNSLWFGFQFKGNSMFLLSVQFGFMCFKMLIGSQFLLKICQLAFFFIYKNYFSLPLLSLPDGTLIPLSSMSSLSLTPPIYGTSMSTYFASPCTTIALIVILVID